MSSDHVPVARVVTEAGRPARPLPIPFSRRAQVVLAPLRAGGRAVLFAAFGMWPLTAVLLMSALMLIFVSRGP